MSKEVLAVLISGLLSLVGVIITVVIEHKLTLYRIEQLEKKQDKHNSVIERVFHLEEKTTVLEERQKVANHRIDDLEHKAG